MFGCFVIKIASQDRATKWKRKERMRHKNAQRAWWMHFNRRTAAYLFLKMKRDRPDQAEEWHTSCTRPYDHPANASTAYVRGRWLELDSLAL